MNAFPTLPQQYQHQQARIAMVILSPYAISAEALAALLKQHPQCDVAGTFSSVEACLCAMGSEPHESVLALLEMESVAAIGEIAQLLQAPGISRVLVLTSVSDADLQDAAVTAGASGIVRKQESVPTLIKALARVSSGELWLDRAATGRIFQAMARKTLQPAQEPEQAKIDLLTRKELLIISELVATPSASGEQLAERLHISKHTLRNHMSAIYAKLGLANRTDLYAYVRRHNIGAALPQHKA